MAVRQRILNSTAPFSGLPQAKLKGPYQSCPTPDEGTEEVEVEQHKGMFMFPSFKPILDKLLTQGTAEQVGEGPLKNSSFIAQAECETQDSQEFSPSCYERSSYVASPNCFTSSSVSSEHNNVACPRTASVQEPNGSQTQLSPRKKPRKRQKRKEKKKEEKKEEKKRQRQRVPSGVPEQESGSSVVQLQEEVSNKSCRGGRRRSNGTSCCSSTGTSCCSSTGTSCCSSTGTSCCSSSSIGTSCCSGIESSEVQDTGPPLHHPQQICCQGPGGRAAALACWGTTAAVLGGPFSDLTARGRDSDAEESSSSACSSVGDCTLALAGLRGSVSQGDPCYAGPFFRDVERDAREEEEELSSASSSFVNEGLFFYNENFQPVDSEYREGREYFVSRFIKQGAYGEVHSGQDVNTGFRFAAKKIHLKRFSSEEVGAWSTLRSPRVVELFGAVREGPYVVLFMDHKHGSVGQLIAERGRLPEDLALHYHWQVLGALLYLLKKRVVHLDIKADNVLLSEDGKDTFLCDFGHSERLDNHGQSLSGCRDLKGTETHMAPEIVKALPRGAKADVWSSCCLLLHTLNGCQPWTRYYACRLSLYLKIANEPPPLREIPSDCSELTAEVIRAGLQKDPVKRASASDLKEKTARALKEVGGLASPVRGGAYVEPLRLVDKPPDSPQPSGVSFKEEEEEEEEEEQRTQDGGRSSYEPDNGDDEEEEEEEMKADTEKKMDQGSPLRLQTRCHDEPNNKTANVITTVSELELRKLERDFYLSSLSQLHSAEIQEQLLSCLSSDCYSNWEPWDKKDSGRWSLSPGDDLSSGVFSYNSQPEGQVLSMDWLTHTQLAPPCCFEGVDVSIRDFNGRSIRIRETRRVKVGHIATGISDQISERVFTLETQEGQQVAHDEEVQDSGLELCCVSAPDCSPSWRWRIRDGLLETR